MSLGLGLVMGGLVVLPNGRSMNTGDSGAEDSGRLW